MGYGLPLLVEIENSHHIGICASCLTLTVCRGYGIVSGDGMEVRCSNTVCLCRPCAVRTCREYTNLMEGERWTRR